MSGLDSLIEHQGFYDYLNHLISGAVFVVGLESITKVFDFSVIQSAFDFIGLLQPPNQSAEFLWNVCVISIFILATFLIGMTFHELYGVFYSHRAFIPKRLLQKNETSSKEIPNRFLAHLRSILRKCRQSTSRLFFKTTIDQYLEMMFSPEGLIENERKRLEYRELAVSFMKESATVSDRMKFDVESKEIASFFFSHCSYYIQIKNQNRKTEKLRDIAGLSESLSLIAMILSIFSILAIPINYFLLQSELKFGILICYFGVFSVFSILMDLRTEKSIKNRIRMTLGMCLSIKKSCKRAPKK